MRASQHVSYRLLWLLDQPFKIYLLLYIFSKYLVYIYHFMVRALQKLVVDADRLFVDHVVEMFLLNWKRSIYVGNLVFDELHKNV